MDIEFDPAKDAANRLKHELSLSQAASLDWDDLFVRINSRRDYGEIREIGLGTVGDRLHCVVFVRLANGNCRIISLRKADLREKRTYEKAQAD